MTNETPEEVRAYLSRIGSKRTDRKTASSRANIEKATAARRHPSICTCGRGDVEPLAHKSTCRIYQAEKARLRRAAQNTPATMEQTAVSVATTPPRPKGRPPKNRDAQTPVQAPGAPETAA